MPSVADSVRVSFGTPNHAGLYTVTAVTDSKNYETGVGIGTLLVKMRSKGVKLNWNERFVNGKITAEEAKNFDFKATLSADGDVTIAQDNVHYLYSGFTSKWKIYSSTTTPPTEPGSYVMTVVTLVEIIRQHRSHVDSRLQNKLQNNIVKRPLVLPGLFVL